jgi:glycosyltransferase involved in cell wall biosynthesis
MPKVSVIIPVLNYERCAEDCLRSVTGQSEGDVEIIVVDDGSIDRSLDPVKQAASRDTGIRVCLRNRTAATLRLRAISALQGYVGQTIGSGSSRPAERVTARTCGRCQRMMRQFS